MKDHQTIDGPHGRLCYRSAECRQRESGRRVGWASPTNQGHLQGGTDMITKEAIHAAQAIAARRVDGDDLRAALLTGTPAYVVSVS